MDEVREFEDEYGWSQVHNCRTMPGKSAATLPGLIERRFFPETRIMAFRLDVLAGTQEWHPEGGSRG
jgi:hypothetical protein